MTTPFQAMLQGKRPTVLTEVDQQRGFYLIPEHAPQGAAGQAALAGKPLRNPAGDQYLFRFGMTIVPVTPPNQRAVLVLMMNPGSAGKQVGATTISADNTVKRLYRQLGPEFGRIITVNTMPFYDSASQHLRQTIRTLADEAGITPANWSQANVSSIQAILAQLNAQGENVDILLGTGNLQSYNRAEFGKIMRALTPDQRANHLYAGKILKSGDSAHLNPQGPLFDFGQENWLPVRLVPTRVGRSASFHVAPKEGSAHG